MSPRLSSSLLSCLRPSSCSNQIVALLSSSNARSSQQEARQSQSNCCPEARRRRSWLSNRAFSMAMTAGAAKFADGSELTRRPVLYPLTSVQPGAPGSLLRSKAEHLVLAGPFGWQVGEAGNSHAMREPPVDGGLDEIGREEGKRDCHIHLADAAPLALGDAARGCRFSARSSSSQRRPRAIDATKVARFSERIGRACCGDTPSGTESHGAALILSFAKRPEGRRWMPPSGDPFPVLRQAG